MGHKRLPKYEKIYNLEKFIRKTKTEQPVAIEGVLGFPRLEPVKSLEELVERYFSKDSLKKMSGHQFTTTFEARYVSGIPIGKWVLVKYSYFPSEIEVSGKFSPELYRAYKKHQYVFALGMYKPRTEKKREYIDLYFIVVGNKKNCEYIPAGDREIDILESDGKRIPCAVSQ